ncbi:MAG: 16S rRNA (adenine(1518)-N(6)/adenine(1519)-N(6))-dimethyltransferase RsmA [Planctomycetota bacterium]|nr:16S rRNA (adenine(1518)-N(6)/adenine(1519)-N(6))-dimethyltransferase RsmA [Planctomycetota bacterium]
MVTPSMIRLSDVKPLLRSRGFRPRSALGQNFLSDPNTLRFIAGSAGATSRDLILEVGTGPGFLTQYLAEAAGSVYSVEVDPILFDVASVLLASRSNVHLIRGDILESKQTVAGEILEQIPDPPRTDGSIIHVSNLPYSVAVPIVIGLLEQEERIQRMVITVQREIADRLLASPGTKTYGVATVFVRLLADVRSLKSLPASVFWPVPEVRSTVLEICRTRPRIEDPEYRLFKAFARGLYTQRRKTLLRGMRGNPAGPIDDSTARTALDAVGVLPDRRVETLDPEALLGLFRAVRAASGDLPAHLDTRRKGR